MRVKICGVTSPEDAVAAVEAGADAIGLIFAKSRRRVDLETAEQIVSALPPFVTSVGVFVDAPPRLVSQTARRLGLGLVQLHGRETLREVAELAPIRAIKAVGIRDQASVDQTQAFLEQGQPGNLAAVLLDAITDRSFGGTGVSFDWNLVAGLPEMIRASHRLPCILAGGLTAENVAEAIRTVRPYAVDVSSGVEASPGKKDRQKMVQFVRAARDAFAGLDAAADASA